VKGEKSDCACVMTKKNWIWLKKVLVKIESEIENLKNSHVKVETSDSYGKCIN